MADQTDMKSYIAAWKTTHADNFATLNLLVEKGVDPNVIVYERDTTKLMLVATNNDVAGVKSLIRLPGIDVNKPDKYGETPLHFTTDPNVTRILVEAGANINAIDSNGNTPIMMAGKSPDAIRYLVSKGADLTVVNKHNHTIHKLVRDKSLLRNTTELIKEQLADINDTEKLEIVNGIIAQFTKEQKSKLIQDIIGDMMTTKPLA
jgi:ankyrin repeat protein